MLIAKDGIDTGKAKKVAAALFPNPELTVGLFSSFTQGCTPGRCGGIMPQPSPLFLIAGQRGYRVERASLGAAGAEAELEEAVRQLGFTVNDFQVAAADYRQTEMTVRSELEHAYDRFLEARRMVRAYQTGVLDRVLTLLTIAQEEREKGELGILELVDVARRCVEIGTCRRSGHSIRFFFLTNSYRPSYILPNICGMNDGKRVQFPRGPAAVTEDELRESHCPKTVIRENLK